MVDYNTYIKSEAWKKKREEFFASGLPQSKKCYICEKLRAKWFHVHHMTYVRLGHEDLKDLVLMCEPCHDQVHAFHEVRKINNKCAAIASSTNEVKRQLFKPAGKTVWPKHTPKTKKSKECYTPTLQEFESSKSKKGGYKHAKLRQWGVKTPLKKGWRRELIARIKAAHPNERRARSIETTYEDYGDAHSPSTDEEVMMQHFKSI